MPGLLCAAAAVPHAGTTDVDVQVDLEIANGSLGAARLERALLDAGFAPENEVWRWTTETTLGTRAVVKFELLADLEDTPANHVVHFDECDQLGAANVRGTGFASMDAHEMQLSADVDGVVRHVSINVTGLAGFLMAKVGAAKSRAKPRDWYDIAFVLLHNDAHADGADAVTAAFGSVAGSRSALLDLQANFQDETCQGVQAYVDQMSVSDPSGDPRVHAADAQLAVGRFCSSLLAG